MRCEKWRFDAVLFDFDGTLADSGEDIWDSVRYGAAQVGGGLPEELTRNPANLALTVQDLFWMLEPPVEPGRCEQFKREVGRHYRSINPLDKTRLYPGMEQLLEDIHAAGLPCHIVTLKEAPALERVLKLKGWDRYFGGRLSPDSLAGRLCTKAELIAHLLRGLAARHPVYIGDNGADMAAAHENGIPCIAALYGVGDKRALLRENPEYAARDVPELAGILKGAGS